MSNLNKDIDFKNLREAFRSLDKNNTGMLTINEIKDAFNESAIPSEDVSKIFNMIDIDHDGVINYSEFLAATMDKTKALTMQNLMFAFHHFDVDNSGYITEQNLSEVFHREGKKISKEQIHEILESVDIEKKGNISLLSRCR